MYVSRKDKTETTQGPRRDAPFNTWGGIFLLRACRERRCGVFPTFLEGHLPPFTSSVWFPSEAPSEGGLADIQMARVSSEAASPSRAVPRSPSATPRCLWGGSAFTVMRSQWFPPHRCPQSLEKHPRRLPPSQLSTVHAEGEQAPGCLA